MIWCAMIFVFNLWEWYQHVLIPNSFDATTITFCFLLFLAAILSQFLFYTPLLYRSIHLPEDLFISISIYFYHTCACVFRSNFQPIDLFIIISSYHCVSISTNLFIHLSIYLRMYVSISMSAYLPAYLSNLFQNPLCSPRLNIEVHH